MGGYQHGFLDRNSKYGYLISTIYRMSFESLMKEWQTLNLSMEALAALGAELRIRREHAGDDSPVRSLLREVVHNLQPGLLDGVNANQEAVALSVIQASFRQAIDLLEDPGRVPGWNYEDPSILESQGQASRLIVRGIATLAAQRSEVDAFLHRPGAFLDVGTGVGWIAIEAARAWPRLRVVGIDFWEPALALARMNLAQSGVAERIELRKERVEQLDEEKVFNVAWLPGPFIAKDIMALVLERLWHALVAGGWLIIGLYVPPPGKLGEALTNLRIVRSGGHPWATPELMDRLEAAGFEQMESASPSPSIIFVLGRRPN